MKPKTPKCPKCKRNVTRAADRGGKKYCPYCGTRLDDSPVNGTGLSKATAPVR